MKRVGWWVVELCGLVLTVAVAGSAQEIVGALTNFDVVNVFECPVDDFEMCFYGIYDPLCVEGWFDGWGTPPTVFENVDGFCVRWADCEHGILPGDGRHFGLYLTPECLEAMYYDGICIRAFWTIGEIRVMEVPLPEQFWLTRDGYVVDVVRYCNDDVGIVRITRDVAVLPVRLRLDQLMWDTIDETVDRYVGGWMRFEDNQEFAPNGEDLEALIDISPDDRSVIVKYSIEWNGEIVTRVINEAYIVPPCK